MNALKNLKSKLARSRGDKKGGGKNDTSQPINEPQDFDILLGRGKTSFNHVGNRRFRVFIGLHLRRYMDAQSRMEKTLVVNSVVEAIQEAGGRFLKQDAKSKKWFQVNAKMAREKVGHALRDAVGMRMKMVAGNGEAQVPPMVRRASEVAREKARRNSVTELPRPGLPGPGRFSKSCSDLISTDEVGAVRSSMAVSAQKAMLELAGELEDVDDIGPITRMGSGLGSVGLVGLDEGGSSELMFDPLVLPDMPHKSVSNKSTEPIPIKLQTPSHNSNASGGLKRTPDRMPSALPTTVDGNTPKLNNSARKGMAIAPPPPRITITNGDTSLGNEYKRSTFDGGSAEFSVMSEATSKKWFDLGSGEFSVATVDSKVFDDNGGDNGSNNNSNHDHHHHDGDPNLPKHLMDKVNKALTDLEVSGELTAKKNKSGGSGMFRRKQNMKKTGKSATSLLSDIDLSEEFSVMSLDTRGRIDEDFGLKSEEFGLKPEEFARAGGTFKSEEFALKSEEFTRSNSVNGATFEFDPHSSLVSSMRMSSTEFSVKSRDFEALRDHQQFGSGENLRGSGSSEFMMKVAKIADVGARDSGNSAMSRQSKITWNLDHEESNGAAGGGVQPKGLIMDTVLEGVSLDEQSSSVSLRPGAEVTEIIPLSSNDSQDNAASTEFSVKSGDWKNAMDSLAT